MSLFGHLVNSMALALGMLLVLYGLFGNDLRWPVFAGVGLISGLCVSAVDYLRGDS